MSEHNVEVVRAGFEALDEIGVEGLIGIIHPEEFEFTVPPDLSVEPDTYRGAEGLRHYFDSFYEVMDQVRFVPQDFIAEGEDRVVVPFTVVVRGRETGIETEQTGVMVWRLRDDKASGLQVFRTLEQATEAIHDADRGSG